MSHASRQSRTEFQRGSPNVVWSPRLPFVLPTPLRWIVTIDAAARDGPEPASSLMARATVFGDIKVRYK